MKRLTQQAYKGVGLMLIAVVIGGLGFTTTSESSVVAQQAQPIPSANDDVRIVAGLLLAQELLNIASTTAVTPSGMLKLATAPIQGWEAVGGTGLTPQARAAAGSSSLARSEVLLAPAAPEFQITSTTKIKNPLLQRAGAAQNTMLNTVYKAMTEAESAGQMELAYALASIYLTNGLFNFFNRGVIIGLERVANCLAGKDIKLEITDPSTGKATEFPVECSKYKALRAVVTTEIAPGAYSFFGPLADPPIGCKELLELATDAKQLGLKSGTKLAAARAYVQGVQVFPGVFQPCIEPSEEQSEVDALLAAARQAKENNHQELLQELAGLDYQVYNDGEGAPIAIYSSFASRRGLAKAVQGAETSKLEELLTLDEEFGLAAYYELSDQWVSKPEAELRQLMADGATPAVRRAATKALLIQLGRAFDVQCLQNLANGQECK
ncbi:MAG: hypothetical protein K6T71_05560 [Candidatus Bipolaricaulota bacterium]|nr:hypothetical protein [Candidatus Bipolaricaulota bacterium]